MPKTITQTADTDDVVKNILLNYPLPDGILRELIQNSDDAGAMRQLFVIDNRRHSTTSLFHADYDGYQLSPALIAYNDALFQDKDWISLEKILKSSKTDANAFGKFGQGFRSVYHLTDCPQVFSGYTLELLNLLHADQGLQFNMSSEEDAKYVSHIEPFHGIPTISYSSSSPSEMPGTVIRLPLRTHASRVSSKCCKPDDVLALFDEFIKSDLNCVLLFLKNIREINIWEINSDGSTREICYAKMRDKGTRQSRAGEYETWKVTVEVNGNPGTTTEITATTWRIITCPFIDHRSLEMLRQLPLSQDLEGDMRRGKLNQRITLATPLSDSNPIYQRWCEGRLFNGLPLPTSLATDWPVHVDARFAIDPSRRHLRQAFGENEINANLASFEDKWNPVLFKLFIPQAWTFLLHVLAREDHVQDIFQFWPPHGNTGAIYRAVRERLGMLQRVFNLVVVAKPPIWPVYARGTLASAGAVVAQSGPEYTELAHLKVAKDSITSELRDALADSGLRFTRPPSHILALIEKSSQFEFLDEKNVHAALLQNVSKLSQAISATPGHANVILTYLLRSDDMSLLAGLPLLTNVDGQYITLNLLASASNREKQTMHPLLDAFSSPIFTPFDPNAIALEKLPLPQTIMKSFRTKAPGTLNIVELTVQRVKGYLSTDPRWISGSDPNSTLQDPVSTETLSWLLKFWKWVETWALRDQLLKMDEVRQLYLVPTHLGLKRIEDSVFDMSIAPALARCLRGLGIGLVAYNMGATVLSRLGVIRKIEDVKAILKDATLTPGATASSTGNSTATSLGLTCADWKTLIDHIARSDLDPATLTEDERKNLRLLPIYPILDPLNSKPYPSPIPENKAIMGITSMEILPIIEGQVFLDLRGYSTASYEILRILQSPTQHRHPEHYKEPVPLPKLLDLAVSNFLSQPPAIKKRIVEYVMKHEKEVSRAVLEKLWEMEFIVGRDGVCRRPGEVLDPESGAGEVLMMAVKVLESDGGEANTRFDKYLPRLESDEDQQIVKNLRELPVCPLRRTMNQEMLLDVTQIISDKKAVEVSRRLLKLLATSSEYGEFVKMIPKEYRWITTNLGLKAAHECWYNNARSALFDEVMPLVEDGIHITDILKGVLGWTEELSHQVLFDQLHLTLKKDGSYSKVNEIVKEIGSCPLTEGDLEALRSMLEGRAWVPTKVGRLVKPENAVFEQPVDGAEFWEVLFNEAAYPGVVSFLRSMGVAERPMTDAILNWLEQCGPDPFPAEKIASVVKVLEILPPDLDIATKSRVLVPDITCRMHPISDLCFNDTGTPPERLPRHLRSIAHGSITRPLARKLGIEPVASGLSRYMGESFTTSIQTAIKNYNETQLLIEMLANAVDAGAKRFVIVVDEMPTSSERLMLSNLNVFHQCPALLVYNDAAFSEEDFHGLCNTGVGGKRRQRNTIGQFGRGALTMFHLTELPMIMSAGHAMFIDPSRKHLSSLPSNTNIQQIELEALRRFYPGHLDFLNDIGVLFNLEPEEITAFSGTLFRLPMRTEDQIQHESPVSNVLWSAKDLRERILDKFKAVAHNCFLFTGLESIEVFQRTQQQTEVELLWDLRAESSNMVSEDHFQRRMVQITSDQGQRTLWQTVSFDVPEELIPQPQAALIGKYNLRHPKVALAAFIRPPEAQHQDYHHKGVLFSTMPLTESTGLPVHCSATFITTDDRRHVRLQLDNDPEHQAEYNIWLLTAIIPPLYLYLLEVLLTTGVPNEHFWPINDSAGSVDHHIIQALYGTHLGTSSRRLFGSTFNSERHMSREEVFILWERSPIRPIIDILAPENVSIYSEPFHSRIIDDAELSPVTPRFLGDEIRNNLARMARALISLDPDQEPELSTEVLEEIIKFFIESDPSQLLGLPLLPLFSGLFAIIDTAGPPSPFPSPNSPMTYYVWTHDRVPRQILINTERLVKLEFAGEMLLHRGFNVEELTSASIALSMEETFPKAEFFDFAETPGIQQFIDDFWDDFHHSTLEVEDIVDFPLVPTLVAGYYVSLNACLDRVAIIPILVGDDICECLSVLGIPIVRRSSPPCPHSLLRILEDRNRFPEFKMNHILRAMSYINPQDLVLRFHSLDPDNRELFADWIRTQLLLDVPGPVVPIARRLPVWSACDQDRLYTNVPADELVIIPEGVVDVVAVAPYLARQRIAIIPQDRVSRSILVGLGARALSPHNLLVTVTPNLPRVMPTPEERIAYRGLVEMILNHVEDDRLGGLLLPNASDFTMTPMTEFYAREDLFIAMFHSDSPQFVCTEFEDLEGRLCHIKRIQDMDMRMFAECARSIAEERDGEGAVAAFGVFNHALPIRLAALGPAASHWGLIEDVRFIPESEEALWRGEGLDVSRYCVRRFDGFVAPRDVVREEYLGIAWSQRRRPAIALSQTVVTAYPELGRPSISEVVRHLRVLATEVARDHPNHPAILPDLIATYRYLNERADEARNDLEELVDEPLWLNVDDLGVVAWQWESAANLSFDIQDIGNFRSARRFLQDYRYLLLAAGAQAVNYPVSQGSLRSGGTLGGGEGDSRLRRKYDQMRRNGKLVDVEFMTQDAVPGEPLLGHRSFLAANSGHLEMSFFNTLDRSRACVAFVLDCIYTNVISHLADYRVLLDGLDLARYWEMTELVDAIQDHIIAGGVVNAQNVEEIQRIAGERDAARVERYCSAFAVENVEYISRVVQQQPM